MASSDIYETKEPPNQSRRTGSAVSQRRDEYLRATGGEVAPHHRHRHHHSGHNRRPPGRKAVLSGLGLLVLAAGMIWWLISRR